LVVVLVGLGVIAAAVFLGVRSWPSDTLDAATVLARSGDAEANLLARATEGKVLHFAAAYYIRHGPADPLVREMSGDSYVPESIRTELWSQVGPSGRIATVYSRVTDEDGRLVQEVTTQGNEIVNRTAASGAEERWPLDWSVKDIARRVGAGAREIEEEIGGGTGKIAGYSESGEQKSIIVELRREREPPPPEEGVRGYSLPYTLDLASVERVQRIQVDAETFMPFREWWVAVDAAGNEHPIEESVILANEILEPADVPPDVFGAASW
jgi:hypothetical protein